MHKNLFDGHLVFKSSKKFNGATGRLKHNENLKKVTKFFEKKISLKRNQLFRNSKMVCPKDCLYKNLAFPKSFFIGRT